MPKRAFHSRHARCRCCWLNQASAGIFKVRGLYHLFDVRWRSKAFLSIQFSQQDDCRFEMKCDSLVFSGYFDGRIDDYVSFLQWNTTTGKVTIFLSPSLHNTLTLTNSLIVERNIYRFIDMIGLILLFLSWFMIHRGANSAYTRLSGITVRKSRKVRRDLRAVYP